jgi:hypothetical protein
VRPLLILGAGSNFDIRVGHVLTNPYNQQNKNTMIEIKNYHEPEPESPVCTSRERLDCITAG